MGACGSSARVANPSAEGMPSKRTESSSWTSWTSKSKSFFFEKKKSGSQEDLSLSPTLPAFTGNAGIITDRYEFDSMIGQGTFAQVYLGVDLKTGHSTAIKCIELGSEDYAEAAAKEALLLHGLKHNNIVQLIDVYVDDFEMHLITELGEGGELYTELRRAGRLNELDASVVMRDMLAGVNFLHSRDIVHRDLKPENLVLARAGPLRENVVKIIDFGVARRCRRGQIMHSMVGTAFYTAPEVLGKRYTRSCDNWSAGAVMFTILSGAPPFPGKTDAEILKKARTGKWDFERPVWNHISQEAKDLISGLMKVIMGSRLSAGKAMQSVWLAKNAPRAPVFLSPTSTTSTTCSLPDEMGRLPSDVSIQTSL